MGWRLFDDDDTENVELSNIEIDKEYARRYEHNKKREDLQRYEELNRRGQIQYSNSESDSESSDEEDDESKLGKKEDIKKLFENLIKVKKHDPSVYQNVPLFESESESDDDRKEENKGGKKKAKYLKDVVAQHLLEEGPEFEDAELSKTKRKKTYDEEQEELKKTFLDEMKNFEEDGDEGDLLKVKEKKNESEDDDDDGEFEKKLGEYFGPDGTLDENSKFLKDFFEKQMWVDMENKERRSLVEDDEVDELLRDDEELERQEIYEESYNFRYEENAGDRVMGHSRIVEGSVRKKENARKEQRKNKIERMKIAEMERKEELKHLKNLKKEEMKERLRKVMEVAGATDDNDFALDLDDLEEDFDPAEYDKMMKKAFGEEYYNADDVDPGFGSDNDVDYGDSERPDFDKEDEFLGLLKGWDSVENDDGFVAARKKVLAKLSMNDNDDDGKEEEEVKGSAAEEDDDDDDNKEEEKERGSAVEKNEESEQNRKRKRKMSLVQRAKEAMLEEYYKLDYEDTIGDLKTRFKYAKVKPNRFGLKTEEMLMLDDKELNQFVSVKKIAPFKEKEWKVPNNKRYEYKMKVRELLRGKLNNGKTSKKKSSRENGDKSTSIIGSHQDGKPELMETNMEMGNLSRQARRKRSQAALKLSKSRMAAYLNMQPKAKGKRKH